MGDKVRVKAQFPPGHVRTPYYLRGKSGVIERPLGAYGNPEVLAYGLDGVKRDLYRVRFTLGEVWGDEAENPEDTLDAEIFSHWLERTD